MDFTEQNKPLFESLMALIRSTSTLNAQDVDFVRSLNRSFGERSANASEQILTLINELMQACQSTKSSLGQPFTGPEDLIKRWRNVEQTLELLLDKLDDPPVSQMANLSHSAESNKDAQVKEYMKLANNIAKPQLKFTTKVNNTHGPFKPLLTQKPHATFVSLSKSLEIQPPDETHQNEWYQQPYLQEIIKSKCTVSPGNNEFPNWEKTPITYVDTPKALFKMLSKLEKANVIAVDVEHHDYRSYLGLVCLVQITGNGEDFIVDALKLRSELQVLNKVFANPEIVKVLHGAKMDIMWLQRDLGIYIVNLFDTYFAARELLFPKLSLAYLLQTFASFDAQKKFQLADWRMRPLPTELIDYARADTHFLPYIYSQLYAKLVEEGKLDIVLEESRKVAAQRYENPGWNLHEPEWINFALKYRIQGHVGRAVLIRLFEWRDKIARIHDESPRFIMSPSFMANLCLTKPRNGAGVLNATQKCSQIVRSKAEEVAKVVQEACKQANNIDTTIPERVRPASTLCPPSSDANIDVQKLRASPKLICDSQSTPKISKKQHEKVYLGIILPEDLSKAKDINLKAAEYQESLIQQRKNEEEPQRKVIESQQDVIQKLPEKSTDRQTGTFGKKINIVQDSDDVKLEIKPSKRNKQQINEPAFDFSSAKEVLGSGNSAEGSSMFMNRFGDQPKGARRGNNKKARSFR